MSEQEHNVIKRAETATGPMNIRHIPTFLQKAAYITALEIASPSADCFRSQNMQQLLATTFPMLRELVLTVRDPRVASSMSMSTAAAMHVVPARYPRLVALHLDGIQIAGPGLPPLLRRLALLNHPTGGGARRLEWAAFLSLLNTARRLACVGLSRYLDYVQPSPRARAGVEGTALELDLPELRELYLREGREGTTAVTVAMVPSAPALVRREVRARVVFVGAGGIGSAGRVGGFDIDLRGPQDTGLHAEIRARAVGEEEEGEGEGEGGGEEQEERAMLEGAARILSCAHVMSVECVHPPWGMSEAKWAVLLSELHSLREIAVVQREGEGEEEAAEAEEEGEEDDDGEGEEEEEERRRRRELKAEGLTRGARTLIAALLSFRDAEAAYRGRRERNVERKERYRGYRLSQGGLGGGRRSDREERLDSLALFPKVEAVVVRGPGTFRYVKVLQLVPVGGYHHAGVVNTPRGYAYGCV